MSHVRNGFTLIEILVASTLFVSLMGLTAIAFHRISSGSEKTLQVLELHAKADTILRYMESDLRNMPQTTAFHLQNTVEPFTLTFMKPVADTDPGYFHKGSTENSTNHFVAESPRLTDLIWVQWQMEAGRFARGQSRINHSQTNIGAGSNDNYNVLTRGYITSLDLKSSVPKGIQNNAISPTPQRHFEFFVGTGGVNGINADGSSAAKAGEKLEVYKMVANSDFVDADSAPWRQGDYMKLFTTLELGDKEKLSDPDACAVRNIDGLSVNKDRLNLIGCNDVDSDGNKIYPNQVKFLFSGTEYIQIECIGRDGRVIGPTDESDRLSDGSSSLDISGTDPDNGYGFKKRPTHIRISYLLHAVDLKNRDEEDYDNDSDSDESLSQSIRDVVAAESLGTRLERIKSFKRHALKHGYASVLITQSVQLGY